MRRLIGVVVLALFAFAAAPARPADEPQPQASALPAPPAGTVPAPGYANVVQCAPKTRCLTADLLPIGTPIKVLVTGSIVGKFNEYAATGSATILPADDVVANGRLIVLKGVPGRMLGGNVIAFVGPCASITVAAMYVWTQDYQFLPISFGDPRSGAPNAFTFAMSTQGLQCRRSNVEATAYISGPPTLKLPTR